MNYVRFQGEDGPCWGVVKDDRVLTLSEAPYERLRYDGGSLPLAACRLLAPSVPTKIVCVGKNYYDHAMELGGEVPDRPILFLKGPNCVNCHEGAVSAPDFVKRLDYEGELAFVIRRTAKNVKPADAMSYILGYTCFNDLTARDVQSEDGQWTRSKSMDGFAAFGPWIAGDLDPGDLKLETRLNGRTVQSARTSLLMNRIPDLIAFITASMTLEPGDVVATGTPAGIGPMHPGDIVEVEVEGIGTLRNHVI